MNHPMQPTPQQFGEWLAEACALHPTGRPGDIAGHVARRAYAAGADAELEACARYLPSWSRGDLRAARRPAPTPQQRALAAIGAALAAGRLTPEEYSAISEAMGGLEIANA